MRQLLSLVSLFVLTALPLSLHATHIVGGEMTYRCLGNDQYEVKLTIFRDCFNGVPWFDNPASIGVFNNVTNTYITDIAVFLDPLLNDTLNPTLQGDCIVVPPDVCVHTTTYTTTINLPFLADGYHLVYQRCCRNNTITNLAYPEDVGATYSIVVSPEALLECNTSPVFNEWPPLFLCAGLPFDIDQSAVDADGDSLVYKLCNPLTGANPDFPIPQPPNPPPYDTVPWLFPYGVDRMLNPPPAEPMTIDSETGLLTGTPTVIGQFVIGICVEEYRDGQLIGTNRRDYQVNVGDCQIVTSTFFAPESICGSLTVEPDNQSSNTDSFEWFFNDPNNPGATSNLFNPSYTYSEPGTYEITLVADPGTVCVDTFSRTVSVQLNSLTADFEIMLLECANDVKLIATDLSVDTSSTIVSWDWTLMIGGMTLTSDEQHPMFVITPPGPGMLSLTVTNEAGCSATAEELFPLKPDHLLLDLGPDIMECQINQLVLDAGAGYQTYLWNDGSDMQTLTVNAPGTYSVSVTDACGEMQTDEINVVINNDEMLDLGPDVEICEGTSFAFDDVGGFASYEWSPADYLSCTDCPSPITTPLDDVAYVLTAMTNDGCLVSDTVLVTLLPNFETSEEVAICDGEEIIVFGNPVSTAGTFTQSFTSQDGCDSSHTVVVSLLPTVAVVEDVVICEGETVLVFGNPVSMEGEFSQTFVSANGCDSVHIISVGVLPVFATSEELSICEGETAVIFGNNESMAGTYTAVFTAANGCDSTHSVNLEVLPNAFVSENISICFGETIELFGTTVGTAGEYEMTFASQNGCDSVHHISLAIFDEIIIDLQTLDVSCFGGSDGSASATVSGGTGGFSYHWETGGNGPSINGLSAGTYSLTVTDNEGCSSVATATIGQPTEVMATALGVDVSCTELGSVSASAIGGTGAHSFVWNTGDNTSEVTSLLAGIYSVTATDANGCEATASVEITGALGPGVSISVDQQLTENEAHAGALSAQVSAGTAPFGFAWNNGATAAAIDSLSSGQYIVTVTDANGCTAVDTAYLFVEACTGGKIWNDRNRDGCQDGGELGVAGVELLLLGTDIWGNPILAVTTSAINGEYIFEGLPPGEYQVDMAVPDGYTVTAANACTDDFTDSDFAPNGTGLDVISLVEGHCCLVVDGGLYDACGNVFAPGVICCDQVLCGPGNDPAPITSMAAASGATGQVEYMWVYSTLPNPGTPNGTWNPVLDAFGNPVTTLSYDPGPISETTHFARCVRTVGCEEWLETVAVTITVDDVSVASINPPGAICVGNEVAFSAADNPPGASYFWDFGYLASPSTSTSASPNVVWSQWGYNVVSLSVTYGGCTSTDELMIVVSNSPTYCGTALVAPPGGSQTGIQTTGFVNGKQFGIYPNPAADILNIEWDGEMEDVQIEIISMEGKLLLKEKAGKSARHFAADVANLNAGIYMLRLRYDGGGQEVLKWVKR